MIASDLDGTVLGPDFRFRPRTVEAITAARDAGIHVVFVTGRPKRWLHPLHEQLEDVGVVICSNGAVVYDLQTERIIETSLFDVGEAFGIMGEISERFPKTLYAAETLDRVFTDPGWSRSDRMEIFPVEEAPIKDCLPHAPVW
ncbi:HAD family hydrolase [Kocuria atrinae]|uniref:HAD family hydrolase n=1 Tax=Kocuria atrinae TaxID=592377 RepID=UPI000306A86C|nr:HAD-IIB family hydrolase [Kocuria atrinae]